MTQKDFNFPSTPSLIEAQFPDVSHFDLDLSLESEEAKRFSAIEWRTDRRGFRRLPNHGAHFQFECLFNDQCNGQIDLNYEVSSAIESKISEITGVKRCGGIVRQSSSRKEFQCDCRLNYTIHIGFKQLTE